MRPSPTCSTAAPPRGSAPAIRSARDYPEHEDGLLVAITERRGREDIDRLAEALGRAVGDLRAAKVAEGVAS